MPNPFLLARKNIKFISDMTRGFQEFDELLKSGQEIEDYVKQRQNDLNTLDEIISQRTDEAVEIINNAHAQAEIIKGNAESYLKTAADEIQKTGQMSESARAEAKRIIDDAKAKAVNEIKKRETERNQLDEEIKDREVRLVGLGNEIKNHQEHLNQIKNQIADIKSRL